MEHIRKYTLTYCTRILCTTFYAQHFRCACFDNFNTYIGRKNNEGSDSLIIKIFAMISYFSC